MAANESLRDKLSPVMDMFDSSLRSEFDELFRLAAVGRRAEEALGEIHRIAGGALGAKSAPKSEGNGAPAASARRAAPARAAKPQPAPGKKARGRPKGSTRDGGKSLRQHVIETLRGAGGPMRVRDITEKVMAAGYRTTSDEPGKVVAALLSSLEEVKRVSKGVYDLK